MTVEERAQELIKEMMHSSGKPMQPMIEKVLRDQIEDCAKVADGHNYEEQKQATEYGDKFPIPRSVHKMLAQGAEMIATEIRALAGQTDQTEGKEVER
jgi:preprotein translocase subunit SecA